MPSVSTGRASLWIESESLGHASLSHRDEGHGVDEAQSPLTPLTQQVEAGLMERLVHPDHFDQRREVRAKTSDRFETEPPARKRARRRPGRRGDCPVRGVARRSPTSTSKHPGRKIVATRARRDYYQEPVHLKESESHRAAGGRVQPEGATLLLALQVRRGKSVHNWTQPERA